jgi:hypothetical protein
VLVKATEKPGYSNIEKNNAYNTSDALLSIIITLSSPSVDSTGFDATSSGVRRAAGVSCLQFIKFSGQFQDIFLKRQWFRPDRLKIAQISILVEDIPQYVYSLNYPFLLQVGRRIPNGVFVLFLFLCLPSSVGRYDTPSEGSVSA